MPKRHAIGFMTNSGSDRFSRSEGQAVSAGRRAPAMEPKTKAFLESVQKNPAFTPEGVRNLFLGAQAKEAK
jgi:hypothetical protein